jgi:hypothetical protein
MDTMQAEIPIWKLVLDLMTQMNNMIQSINLAGMVLAFGLLFVFFLVIYVYAKLDDRIERLEKKLENHDPS